MIPPAKTGRESINKIAVTQILQRNKLRLYQETEFFLFVIVQIKLIAPKIELAPAKCNENISKSTEQPLWAIKEDKGGYTVQPVPKPSFVSKAINKRVKEGGSNQNLKFFKRGNAISGELKYKGISHLPNPPIRTGITKKKIIINP